MKKKLALGISCAIVLMAQPTLAQDNDQLDPEDGAADRNRNLEETFVFGSRRGNFTEITEDTRKLVETAGTLGDPLSAAFSLPGVVYSDGEGGEPAVRGSSPDDNIFLVDFMPAGYVFHEFTNSVFHDLILQDFKLYSAGVGAEYSDVTGAVFDIALRKPKQQKLKTTLDISMLRSGFFVEGGVTENSAFYLSGRKSLIHLFVPEGEEEDGIKVKQVPQDQDYQFKYAWDINSDNTLTLSANGASDKAEAEFGREADFVRSNPDFEGDAELDHTYHGQNLIWDHYGNGGQHLKVGIGRLTNTNEVSWGTAYFQEVTWEQDTIKAQYAFPIGDTHRFTIGGGVYDKTLEYEYDQILFVCTEFNADCSLNRRDRIQDEDSTDNKDTVVYFNESWMPTGRLTIDLGVQYLENDYTEESFTNPRFAMSYELTDAWTLTTSAGKYNRFPDIDTVIPKLGNPDLKSPIAEHYTLGVKQELDNGWSWNLEGYYKELENLPLALGADEPDSDLLYVNEVTGEAYGFDLLINKDITDKWYSWVALSWAKSQRTNTRTEQTRDYFLDTPMVFNWVANYQAKEDFNVSWRWTIRSGSAHTPIDGVQDNPEFEGALLPVYGEPFSERLPNYSRLDIRFKWDISMFNNDAAIILDIINALNQQNVTERTLDYERVNSAGDPVVTEDTVSPGIIPAVGLRMSF